MIGSTQQKRLAEWIGLILIVLLASCVRSPQMTWGSLLQHPAVHNMRLLRLDSQPFEVVAALPAKRQTKTLRVYIEGDGLAWKSRHHLSQDPTPITPLALLLMQQDPYHDKAYLARPCQYVTDPRCDNRYWSSHRFSTEVVNSLDTALTLLKSKGQYEELELVGFSGGGAVATLLAAQRDDVRLLVTVAGNLDHEAFTTLHRVTPLTGSLNPVDVTQQLTNIRQIHFVGSRDRVAPEEVFDSYAQHFTSSARLKKVLVDCSHHDGWLDEWKELLRQVEQF